MNNKWKIKFFIIWFGQAISILSSSVLQMALIWHLSIKSGSATILSLASLAGFLPTAVLGIFAGTFVDRWNKKRTMIVADLFIALVSLSLVVFGLFLEIPVWLVLMILFIRSIGTAFHTPAISAVTPIFVPEDYLTKYSGYTQSLQSIGYIAGVAIAAILYPIWSISGLVMLDVIGAIIACVTTAFVTIPQLSKNPDTNKTHILIEIKEGYEAIKKNKGVFLLLWVGTVFMFIYSPINALFPLMSLDYFGGTTTSASIAEISFSAGMLVGGIILGIWGGLKNRGYTIIFAMAVIGIAIGVSGLLPVNGFAMFSILCVVMGIAVPFYSGPQIALMQEKIEPQYLGRVFGIYGSLMSLAMPLGLALSGLFADVVGVSNWFVLAGVSCLLLAFFSLSFSSIRNIEK